MAKANRLWDAERIRGEMLTLGIRGPAASNQQAIRPCLPEKGLGFPGIWVWRQRPL